MNESKAIDKLTRQLYQGRRTTANRNEPNQENIGLEDVRNILRELQTMIKQISVKNGIQPVQKLQKYLLLTLVNEWLPLFTTENKQLLFYPWFFLESFYHVTLFTLCSLLSLANNTIANNNEIGNGKNRLGFSNLQIDVISFIIKRFIGLASWSTLWSSLQALTDNDLDLQRQTSVDSFHTDNSKNFSKGSPSSSLVSWNSIVSNYFALISKLGNCLPHNTIITKGASIIQQSPNQELNSVNYTNFIGCLLEKPTLYIYLNSIILALIKAGIHHEPKMYQIPISGSNSTAAPLTILFTSRMYNPTSNKPNNNTIKQKHNNPGFIDSPIWLQMNELVKKCHLLSHDHLMAILNILMALNFNDVDQLLIEQSRLRLLYTVIDVWCQSQTLNSLSFDQIKNFNWCLLYLAKYSDTATITTISQYSNYLKGVMTYLECTNLEKRQFGMIVAECISSKSNFSESSPLDFEMSYLSDEAISMRQFFMAESTTCTHELMNEEITDYNLPELKVEEKVVGSNSASEQDPDEIIDDPGECTQSEEETDYFESDEEIPNYESNQSEGQESRFTGDHDSHEKIPKPRYLRDCLDYLCSSEDPNKIELALHHIEAIMTKSDSAALNELSGDICERLILIQNDYELDNFEKLQISALLNLYGKCFESVSKRLIQLLIDTRLTLLQRQLILFCMSQIVHQINCDAVITTPGNTRSKNDTCQELDQTGDTGTVRWKSVKLIKEQMQYSNNRTTISNLNCTRKTRIPSAVFFPLMNTLFMGNQFHQFILTDIILLKSILNTLSNVISCSNNLPEYEAMIQQLWKLCQIVQTFPNNEIIMSLLQCYINMLRPLLDNYHTHQLNINIKTLQIWAEELAKNHPEKSIRETSLNLLSVIFLLGKKKVDNIMFF